MKDGKYMEDLINKMFDVYIEVMKQEDEEQGPKVEQAFNSMLDLVSEEEQIQLKKNALISLLKEL